MGWERIDEFRRGAGPTEGSVVDELVNGEIDRSSFIRRASVLGLAAPTISAALMAVGQAPVAVASNLARTVGGRLRVGIIPPPSGVLDPHTLHADGEEGTVSIAGEYLTRATQGLAIVPELALSWAPNADASVWTFKLRPGVKFQNGQALSADDVVATYKRLVDPTSGSQALSVFQGVLATEGIQKVDDLTVAFHLQLPTASFPYLTSSTTYQGVILPASYQIGSFNKIPQATGAFQLVSYSSGVSAKYDRFPGWWGGTAPLDGVDATYYSDDASAATALLGGAIDLINHIQFATDRGLFNNSDVQVLAAPGSAHREIPMRTDLKNQLHDYRVRQAIALTLDRPAIVKTLYNGAASPGNDSPFSPVYPATDKSVPQRHQDVALAKRLMAQAGFPRGFKIELTANNGAEMPLLAQILQFSVKAIGVDMSLRLLPPSFYNAGTSTGPPTGWGTALWLNAPMTLTPWGHRAVPNVFLTAAFESKGIWNAAHYSNRKFDTAAKSFISAIALSDQRRYAKQMELILLHDTPVIIPIFYSWLAAASKRVTGYKTDAIGQVYLSKTSLG
jgi:peptide/nickel transport system substrate-binding protein